MRLNSIKLSGFKSFAEPTNFMLPGQLVQTFEVSLAEEIEKISHALATHNQQQVEFSLHTLKGFVGLFVVPTLALQVELL